MCDRDQKIAMELWANGLGDINALLGGENPLPDKSIKATRDSWETKRMPDKHVTVNTAMEVPKAQFEELKKGHIPEVIEDHWFMYCTDRHIRYYRSWSGDCIFKATYDKKGDNYVITKIRINNDPEQYESKGQEADIRLFIYLLVAEFGGNSWAAWESYIQGGIWRRRAGKIERLLVRKGGI